MSTRVLSCFLLLVSLPLRSDGGETVTLDEARITLKQALARISTQTKVPVASLLAEDDDPPIRLDLKKATLWEALDAVAEAAGAQVDLTQPDGRIAIVRRFRDKDSILKPQISRSGPYRVVLKRLGAFNDFGTGSRSSRAVVEVAWEPTIEPFYLQSRPQGVTYQDDKGNKVDVRAGSQWSSVTGRRALEFDFDLPSFDRKAEKIGLLKGTFAQRGPSRMHSFTFSLKNNADPTLAELAADIDQDGIVSSAGKDLTKCTLESVTLNQQTWTVRISTELPEGGPDLSSNEMWFTSNEVSLVSVDGKTKLTRSGYEQVNADTKRAVVKYFFRGPQRGEAKNWQLRFRAPASLIEETIPFEFKDVPLP